MTRTSAALAASGPTVPAVAEITDARLTLTELGRELGLSPATMSELVRAGVFAATPGGHGVRRYVEPGEARRLRRIVGAARGAGIAPTVLLVAVAQGAAAELPDGRIVLGDPDESAAA